MLREQAVNHGEEMTKAPIHPLGKILESRIAIIDGATGTTIRTYGMTEADIRGERGNGRLLATPETLHGLRARHLAGAGVARPDNGQSDLCQ